MKKYLLGIFECHSDTSAASMSKARYFLIMLIKSFYKKTNVSILLNTSFNLKGEPIVNSPNDAIRTFYSSSLDILVLNNFIIHK